MVTITPISMLDRMLTLSRAMDAAAESNGATAQLQAWFPALDMYEKDNALFVTLDVPGVKLESLDISYEKNVLTISGSRNANEKQADGEFKVYAAERGSGEFSRSVRLPQFVDAEKIEAHVESGVLRVTIPKSPSSLPRKISIKAA